MKTSDMFFQSAKKINARKFEDLGEAMERGESLEQLANIEAEYNKIYQIEMANFWKCKELEAEI